MNKIWIKEYGNTPESEIQGVINRYMPADSLGIAYYTDRFCSADKKHLAALCEDIPHLLELRLFNDMGELLIRRSHIGGAFVWRLADDNTLEKAAALETDQFLKKPASYYVEYKQYLDIDSSFQSDIDNYGCHTLRTTGGGYYALPVAEKQNMVCIKAYLQYDKNGLAHIADYRLAGFC